MGFLVWNDNGGSYMEILYQLEPTVSWLLSAAVQRSLRPPTFPHTPSPLPAPNAEARLVFSWVCSPGPCRWTWSTCPWGEFTGSCMHPPLAIHHSGQCAGLYRRAHLDLRASEDTWLRQMPRRILGAHVGSVCWISSERCINDPAFHSKDHRNRSAISVSGRGVGMRIAGIALHYFYFIWSRAGFLLHHTWLLVPWASSHEGSVRSGAALHPPSRVIRMLPQSGGWQAACASGGSAWLRTGLHRGE